MQSLSGHLLVASPELLDPNFVRAVVLLIQHTGEGAFGVVLNRPAGNTIRELWEEIGDGVCKSRGHVNMGGPVSGPLIALHTDESLSEMEILPGLHFAAERDHLEELVSQKDHFFRIFVGHSGWGGGQLEGELKEGSWLTTPATVDYVFHDEEDLWKKVTRTIGESVLTSALRIKRVPADPSAN